MARKKKSRGGEAPVTPSMGEHHRVNIGIERAENGAVVHLSTERGGKNPGYESKTMVAPDHEAAAKIAVAHIASMAPKIAKKKKVTGKKPSGKTITKGLAL